MFGQKSVCWERDVSHWHLSFFLEKTFAQKKRCYLGQTVTYYHRGYVWAGERARGWGIGGKSCADFKHQELS